MKNIKKILLAISFIILSGIGIISVFAGVNDSNLEKHRFDGAYAAYDGTDRMHLFYAERFTLNGNTAYCIEPGVKIDTNVYSSTADWNITGLSSEVRRYVRLVAYYGYDYEGHQNMNYYLAAQEMIWEKITGRETYWVTELDVNSTRINIDNEKNIITSLVNNHTKTPSFDEQEVEVNIGDETLINDTNGVLNQFEFYNGISNGASIEGNSLKVKANDSRNTSDITLIKKHYTDKVTLIYHSGDNQKLVSAGVLDPVLAVVKIKSTGGNITGDKKDSETNDKPQGDATLNGAKYGIYNSNQELVDTIISGEKETTKDIPYGTYTIKELEAPKGYELSDKVETVTIDANNQEIKVNLIDNVIRRKYNLFKVFSTDKTTILKGEPNITFEFYLKSTNELYTTATTDNDGYLQVELVYGTYRVKQKNATENYEKVEDFEIKVEESGTPINKLISNAEIKAKLKVIKIDKESGEVIKRSNIKFKIKDVKTKNYVCQRITYPSPENICEYATDENGEFITPYELPSGKYILEEVDQKIDGYLWNQESVEFEIGEKSKFTNDETLGILFEVKFENRRVKGQVKIKKYGEEFTISDGTYQYIRKNLKDVELELYANEDIISPTGEVIYQKDELIKTVKTDKNGFVAIKGLDLGKYFLKEKSTQDDHILDDSKYEFELKYKDQYTEVVSKNITIQNYLKKGGLEFTKTDISSSEALPNTLIEIYTEDDELIYSGRTDENGKIIINDLPIGKRMYILEKEAPEGYKLNEEKMWFEILDNGEIVKATMVDEKVEIEVPNTGLVDYHITLIAAVVLVISGMGVILYGKNKRK